MSHRDTRNAAWQAANQWRAKATQTRPDSLAGTVKLFFTWLLFGAMMIVAMVLGLFLLLIGWAMMPFVRHKMKKTHGRHARAAGHRYRQWQRLPRTPAPPRCAGRQL